MTISVTHKNTLNTLDIYKDMTKFVALSLILELDILERVFHRITIQLRKKRLRKMQYDCLTSMYLNENFIYNLLIAHVQIRTSRFLIRPDFEMTRM